MRGCPLASQQSTVDHLLDQLSPAGRVTAKKMFGEFCVYLDEKPIALVCDDQLFFKPTAAGRELMPGVAEAPPYPGAKPYLLIPRDDWADREAMTRLARATFDELPRPKPRKRKA